MNLKIKILNEFGKINIPAYVGDAGYDVFSTINLQLNPLDRWAIPLGIALEFDSTIVCQVNEKSGLAKNSGFMTIGNIIDSSYRGEIHAIVVNTSNEILNIKQGEKVAQLIFLKVETPIIEYVSELSNTSREENKFGSTGIN
jgi:dUTP pyrophosphatase